MEKDVLVQKERGFIEKFMVPQMYDLFRFGGSSVKDDEMGMQRMLQNFSGLFTEEQLRKNMEKYNLQKMFGVVKEYFKKEYGYAGDSIILSNNYQQTINSYIYNDREKYFPKEIARVQSVWYVQQSERGIKYPGSSKHIQKLYRKKQNAVKDYLHKVTRWIAEYCRKGDIRCVVVGDSRNIRKEKDMGHKTNQKLHSLSYNRLYIMLEYKLKLYGIQLIKQEESYTSRCSPLSPKVSKRYAETSNRKERGMYITDGVRYNADAVGAFNILRKYLSVSGKQKELSVTGLKNPEIIKVAA